MTEREFIDATTARNLLLEGKLEDKYIELCARIRELESENAKLRNRVADYSGEIAALMTAKNLLLKQRAFIVGVLEKPVFGTTQAALALSFIVAPQAT